MNEVHFLGMFPTSCRRPKGGGVTNYGGNKMNEVHFLGMFPTSCQPPKWRGVTIFEER